MAPKDADLDERLKFLHREGHLYDEGIFILSDESIATAVRNEKGGASDDEQAAAAAVSRSCSQSSGGISHEFWNVVHCLSIASEEFNDFRGKISHHWRAARSERLAQIVKSILTLRSTCLSAAISSAQKEFRAAPDSESLSRIGTLLTRVLNEERRRLTAACDAIVPAGRSVTAPLSE